MIAAEYDVLERTLEDAELLEAMKTGIEQFERYRSAIPHRRLSYTRALLRRTPRYELVAMHWAPGAVSPIHDHGSSRCWIFGLEGELYVENFERLDDGTESVVRLSGVTATVLNARDVEARANWRELHRVRNVFDTSAYTLQLYAGPQREYVVVDADTLTCSIAVPNIDFVAGSYFK